MSASWDPNEPGPFDRCLRCFTPYDHRSGFCLRCGENTGYLMYSLFEPPQGSCKNHKKPFIGYCAYCGRPICNECSGTPFYRVMAPFIKFYMCGECLEKRQKIKEAFFKELEEKKICAKHPEVKAEFRCKECGLYLCNRCAYFSYRGLFSKRIEDGPYCLTCFRIKVKKRKKWLCGEDL